MTRTAGPRGGTDTEDRLFPVTELRPRGAARPRAVPSSPSNPSNASRPSSTSTGPSGPAGRASHDPLETARHAHPAGRSHPADRPVPTASTTAAGTGTGAANPRFTPSWASPRPTGSGASPSGPSRSSASPAGSSRPATRTVPRGPSRPRPVRTITADGTAALAPRPAPRAVPRPAPSRPAKPAPRPSLRLVEPTRRRRLRIGGLRFAVTSTVLAVVGVLFGAVVMHADLAARQLRIDRLRSETRDAEQVHEQLKLEVAALEAPDRIVAVAQRLGLQAASGVTFLSPVAPAAAISAATVTGTSVTGDGDAGGGSGTAPGRTAGQVAAGADGARGTP